MRRAAETAAGAIALGPEYVTAVGKIVNSHVRNELYGTTVFEEPAIGLARTPREKWLACRIAMEELGHHLRFKKLAADLHLEDAEAHPPLSVFSFDLQSWTEYVILKAIVDTAEIVIMEDLAECSYGPLARLVDALMPEEVFHVNFGRAGVREILDGRTPRSEIQDAVDALVLASLPMFGRSQSRNNDLFRELAIKRWTNDQARTVYIERTKELVEGEFGLTFPDVPTTWHGDAL